MSKSKHRKHEADFRKHFDIADTEELIEDYKCAFQRDVLVHGRLFISQSYVLFYATVFGWVTTVVIPFADILAIEKKNAALVFPNAIAIRTKSETYFFASFLVRDSAYRMLKFVWDNARSERPLSVDKMIRMTKEEISDFVLRMRDNPASATSSRRADHDDDDLYSDYSDYSFDYYSDEGAAPGARPSAVSSLNLSAPAAAATVATSDTPRSTEDAGAGVGTGGAGSAAGTPRVTLDADDDPLLTGAGAGAGGDGDGDRGHADAPATDSEDALFQSATTGLEGAASSAAGTGDGVTSPITVTVTPSDAGDAGTGQASAVGSPVASVGDAGEAGSGDPSTAGSGDGTGKGGEEAAVAAPKPGDFPLSADAAFPCGCKEGQHNAHPHIDKVVIKMPVVELWEVMFGETSTFQQELFDELGNTDLETTPWSTEMTDLVHGDGVDDDGHVACERTRVVTFRQTVKSPMGTKTANVNEVQHRVRCNAARAVMHGATTSTGVPFADYFDIYNRYCVHAIDDASSELTVTSQINWKKSTWLKSTIEKAGNARTKEFLHSWLDALQRKVTSIAAAKSAAKQTSVKKRLRSLRGKRGYRSGRRKSTASRSSRSRRKHKASVSSQEAAAAAAAARAAQASAAAKQGRMSLLTLLLMAVVFVVVGGLLFAVYSFHAHLESLQDNVNYWQIRTLLLEMNQTTHDGGGGGGTAQTPASALGDFGRRDWYLESHRELEQQFKEWQKQIQQLQVTLLTTQRALKDLSAHVASSRHRNLLLDEQAKCVQAAVDAGSPVAETCFLEQHMPSPADHLDAADVMSPPSAWYRMTSGVLPFLLWVMGSVSVVGMVFAIGRQLGFL